jgi:pimeloyl-ACP methyl ester carboxylesterase
MTVAGTAAAVEFEPPTSDGTWPAWFADAVSVHPEMGSLDVDGCRITTRSWGTPGSPGLVLVHGGGAHSGWWDPIAPFFADSHHVLAIDLSGHGDSDHRPAYDLQGWATELLAVTELARGDGNAPVVIGHSAGGRVATALAVRTPGTISRLIAVDSPLWDGIDESDAEDLRTRQHSVYPSRDAGLARFVPLPQSAAAPCLPFVEKWAGAQSLRPVDGGWTWKFDRNAFGSGGELGDLSGLSCPALLLYGEHGIVERERLRELDGRFIAVELPATGHHPMLEQPLLLVAALRTALATLGTSTKQPLRETQ